MVDLASVDSFVDGASSAVAVDTHNFAVAVAGLVEIVAEVDSY